MDVPNVTDSGLQDIPVAEKIYQTTTSTMDGLQDHPSRFEPFLTLTDGTNLLGLVVYSLMMSIAIKRVGEQGRLLVDIFTAFYQTTLKLISFITWFSPIGIFFLLTSTMIGLEEPSTAFHQVSLYIGTALVAHLGYGLVLLPLVYFLMTRKNPVKFLYKNSLCICTAFATSCSITSALVSIGTRNLPQNGNLGILAVLTVAGIPNENVSLIMAADWILNRMGVTVNTISDVVGTGVIHHLTSVTDLA
ncbi:excitatory amino acid transporter 1-like [Octopus vulgaris]|uniref:Amino acid transporter n=1 Tax=Octopus vulgaris TaxID=6645 RepID=A0AA36B483_OCTVU|nr:excitatory amino acid transporter 1-like [Octopus vulgaris]